MQCPAYQYGLNPSDLNNVWTEVQYRSAYYVRAVQKTVCNEKIITTTMGFIKEPNVTIGDNATYCPTNYIGTCSLDFASQIIYERRVA